MAKRYAGRGPGQTLSEQDSNNFVRRLNLEGQIH
jgi:hypothetical protein